MYVWPYIALLSYHNGVNNHFNLHPPLEMFPFVKDYACSYILFRVKCIDGL
jgi:hypothetical protein